MKNPNQKMELTVKPIRKGEFFEKELLDFSTTFKTIINNNVYNNILGDVINYNYTNLDLYYKNNKFDFNIINFILWITHSFILYSDYVYNFINIYIDTVNIDAQTLFSEFIGKYEELVNCAQLFNSKFENINTIINYLIKFKSLPSEMEKKDLWAYPLHRRQPLLRHPIQVLLLISQMHSICIIYLLKLPKIMYVENYLKKWE